MDDLNAAAEALAGDAVPAEDTTSEAPTPEVSEDDALGAIWDKLNADDGDDAPEDEETQEPAAEEAPEDAADEEDAPAPEAPKIEAPNGLPREVREKWADIPEEARAAIERSHRELSGKLTEQGRQIQGIGPVREALVAAAKDIPHLMNMRPEQVAQEVMELAKISQQFTSKPTETIMGLIDKHGLREAVGKAIGAAPGDQGFAAMRHEIAGLKKQLAEVSDPSRIDQRFEQMTAQQSALSVVQEFAATAPRWSEVEAIIPQFVGMAKELLGEGASGQDVIAKAYDLADYATKPAAKAEAVDETATKPDPERVQKAMKAKSINAKSQPTGAARKLTEDEMLSAAYDRANRK